MARTTTSRPLQRVLSFDREVETAIYNTLPHQTWTPYSKKILLKCPVAYIGGLRPPEK